MDVLNNLNLCINTYRRLKVFLKNFSVFIFKENFFTDRE